jgi:hypothetical protein
MTDPRCDKCRWWGEPVQRKDMLGNLLDHTAACRESPQWVLTAPDHWCGRFREEHEIAQNFREAVIKRDAWP